MKAKVDDDVCTGCGLCMDTCPEVFQLEGAVATVKTAVVPAQAEDSCREGMENCPVDAILIEE